MCKTCHLEGGMQDALKPSDVFPRFGPFDINQQQPKIKPFTGRWVNKVHPSNDITLLVWAPLPVFPIPDKVMREVKIRNLLCSRKGLIGSELLMSILIKYSSIPFYFCFSITSSTSLIHHYAP